MMKSLLNRFTPSSRAEPEPKAPSVDISRAIPGYRKPGPRLAAPEPRDEALLPALGETALEKQDGKLPGGEPGETASPAFLHSERLTEAERAERAVSSLEERMSGWMARDLARLTGAWTAMQADIGASSALILAAHDLKGMGGTYGYPAIARLCSSLCRLIETRVEPRDFALVNLHVEACRAAFLQGRNPASGDAVAQSVCAALEAQVARQLAG